MGEDARGQVLDEPAPGQAREPHQSLLASMFEASSILSGVFELEADDHRYVLANPATAKVYGRTPEQMQGLRGRDLGLSSEELERRMARLWACWRTRETLTLEYPFRHGGRSAWYLGTFTPLAGETPRVSFVLIDITDRKRAELDAERERRRLAVAVEATSLGLWEYHIASDDVHWDARARELFGVGPDEPIDFARYQSRLHPDDAPGVNAAYEAALRGEGGGRFSSIHRAKSADGSWRWLRGSGQVLFGDDGKPRRVMGTMLDITEEVQARERQALLMAELNHRVKNNLATVQSIALQTARRAPDLAAFVKTFEGRILSLARTHDVLTAAAWRSADLRLLLARELSTFSDRLRLEGPQVQLSPTKALAIGLLAHELATNAAKHGAWSTPAGEITVAWKLGAAGRLHLSWSERGGPPVSAPSHAGFGSRLIQRLVTGDLAGEVRLDYRPEGLLCELVFTGSDADA